MASYYSTIPKESGKPYSIFTKTEILIAGHLLNDGSVSFMLYCYFAMNMGNYCFALSPMWIESELGISNKQCIKAKDKLVENGYLVPKQGEKDSYLFVRIPVQYKNVSLDKIDIPTRRERWHQKNDIMQNKEDVDTHNLYLGNVEAAENEEPSTEHPPKETLCKV